MKKGIGNKTIPFFIKRKKISFCTKCIFYGRCFIYDGQEIESPGRLKLTNV